MHVLSATAHTVLIETLIFVVSVCATKVISVSDK
jgi:hypothetical protein